MNDMIGIKWDDVSKLIEAHKKQYDQLRARVAALELCLRDSNERLIEAEYWVDQHNDVHTIDVVNRIKEQVKEAKSLLQ